jgi:hypothetical protein
MYAILKIGASIEASHPHLAARVTPSLALDLPLDMAKAEVENIPPAQQQLAMRQWGKRKRPPECGPSFWNSASLFHDHLPARVFQGHANPPHAP